MTATVLVTGGAGFIGRHVVAALVARGEHVRVFDDLSTGDADAIPADTELAVGDITDAAQVATALTGVDRVVHLAARRAVPGSFDDPVGTDRVNRIGTRVVLATSRAVGVRRVVFASSSSVYGDALVTPTPEDSAFAPLSPYAQSKVDGERLCRATRGLDTVCLRYFNVYGPGQPVDGPYALLVPKALDAIERGNDVVIHGDGLQRRDFTYIDDAIAATVAALDAPRRFAGRAYNVAGSRAWSVLDAVGLLAAALAHQPPLRFVAVRAGDPRCTEADLERAQRELRYRPVVALPDGLRRVAAYSKLHRVALSG